MAGRKKIKTKKQSLLCNAFEWVSIKEAAERLEVHQNTIRNMMNDGRLEFKKVLTRMYLIKIVK